MSETAEEPTAESPENPNKAQKKWKPGFKHKNAVLEIIARKQISDKVDYKAISIRTGISVGSLRRLYCDYSNGRLDMGAPVTPQEKELDDRVQTERLLDTIRRLKGMVLASLEQLVADAEDQMTHGNPLAWKDLGIPSVMKDLKEISTVQVFHTKSFEAVLAEDQERRMREERRALGAAAVPDMEASIVRMTDEERAMKRLSAMVPLEAEAELVPAQ